MGLRVCIDFRDFRIGVPSVINMEEAVEQSRKTLLVLTPDWIESEWTNFEALLAQTDDPMGLRQRTLPLLLKKCKRPRRLAMFTYADFTKPRQRESQLKRVIDTISEATGTADMGGAAGMTEIPLPPEPCFAHHLGLAPHFTGRRSERETLSKWLCGQGAQGDKSLMGLVAIGGMGKSTVAWVWARRDVCGLPVPGLGDDPPDVSKACCVPEAAQPGGVLWWSFYEGGGTFRGFLEVAISYCSGGAKKAQDYLTEAGAGERLMDYSAMQSDLIQLAELGRFLFVWDGAERLLREYGGRDASVREERDPAELEPNACDTLEIPVSRFLEQMAGQSSSRLLVASRLYPRVLEKLSGSAEERLTGLAEEDAVAYLRARGIRGNRAELATAAKQYEFHPLSLSNLAADLLEDFQDEGDISAALKHDQTENVKARQHHILERAYDRRAPPRRELLSRLAAMRGTIPKEVVELLAGDIRGIDAKNLGRELGELVRHGLLRHPSPDRYDFHPVVRRYCYKRLEDKEKTHLRLRDYFEAVPAPSEDEVRSVEDLAPVIELYHHTVRAGRYVEAHELYRDRLSAPLYFRFGAYQMCIELLRGLFPEGEGRPPRLKSEGAQAYALNELANTYSRTGQQRRGVLLFEASNAIDESRGSKEGVAVGLGNVAIQQTMLGELAAAEDNLRRRTALCKEIGDELGEAVGHQQLGWLLVYEARLNESRHHVDASVAYCVASGHKQGHCQNMLTSGLRALLMGDAKDARNAARLAHGMAAVRPNERDMIVSKWLQGWALVALASEEKSQRRERLADAEKHLTEALTSCRRINLVEMEPDILLAWARWHRAKRQPEDARKCAEEALAIADRCEYRLKQADAHNFLSRLALDEDKRGDAREHAETAKERAQCDGPPHWYKPALEEAERLLGEAGKGA